MNFGIERERRERDAKLVPNVEVQWSDVAFAAYPNTCSKSAAVTK